VGTYDLVFKKSNTVSENEGQGLFLEGKELYHQGQFDEAREKFLLAIDSFKKKLATKAHDKVSRQGLEETWENMGMLYVTDQDYLETLEKSRFNYGEQTDKVFAFSHIKTIFMDLALEGEWKTQCNGKYGGPKPIKMSWKKFYFENEKKVESSKSSKNRLKWAVEHGHHEYLAFLFKKSKVQLNVDEYIDKTNLYTYLEIAIRKNFVLVVTLLLDYKAKVNVLGKLKWTPLFWAIFTHNHQIVKLLLEHGAKINIKDENGLTPLHIAARSGSLDITKQLIQAKSKVNVAEKENNLTPLDLAAYNDHYGVVDILVENKADLKKKDKYGRTLLHWASTHGKSKLVATLLKQRIPVDPTDEHKRTPLHWAAQGGHNDVISQLLENKADVNKKDKYGDTSLVIAAFFGHSKEVSNLFEHGAR
jgi:ankyrin repeat protein